CIPVLLWAACTAAVRADGTNQEPSGALFVASDFPRLAKGVYPGIAGDAAVLVWASAQEDWHLVFASGTITLQVRKKPGDSAPRWQALGKVKLARDVPLMVVVSELPPAEESHGQTPRAGAPGFKSAVQPKAASGDGPKPADSTAQKQPTPV